MHDYFDLCCAVLFLQFWWHRPYFKVIGALDWIWTVLLQDRLVIRFRIQSSVCVCVCVWILSTEWFPLSEVWDPRPYMLVPCMWLLSPNRKITKNHSYRIVTSLKSTQKRGIFLFILCLWSKACTMWNFTSSYHTMQRKSKPNFKYVSLQSLGYNGPRVGRFHRESAIRTCRQRTFINHFRRMV